jgi:hypothetical protein
MGRSGEAAELGSKSTNDLTGYLGPDQNGVPGTPNTSTLQAKGANTTDIGGYDKLNNYRVYGSVFRLTQDWSFGTLKFGGLGTLPTHGDTTASSMTAPASRQTTSSRPPAVATRSRRTANCWNNSSLEWYR